MVVIVREATEADIPVLFEIRTGVKENHLSVEAMAARGITPSSILDALKADPCIWIAEVDGIAAGFSMADINEGSVFAAFVRPDFAGQGLGRCVMEKAESFLFKHHARIWLETDGASRAAGFYRALGWVLARTFPNGDIRFEKERPPT